MSHRMSRQSPEKPIDDTTDKSPVKPIEENMEKSLEKSFDDDLEESPEKPAADNLEKSPEKTSDQVVEPPVIDLDEEFSDNDLIASVNPSIAKRMMSRKVKQNATQSPSKEKVTKVVHESPGPENKEREEAGKD